MFTRRSSQVTDSMFTGSLVTVSCHLFTRCFVVVSWKMSLYLSTKEVLLGIIDDMEIISK